MCDEFLENHSDLLVGERKMIRFTFFLDLV